MIGFRRGEPIKRAEADGSIVNFYLDEVTSKEICVSFNVYQDIAIENIKPGYVKIYDYYQPEYETVKVMNCLVTTAKEVVILSSN